MANEAKAKPAERRPGSVALFTIGGIRVTLDYSWFIIFFLVLFSLSAGYFPRLYPGLRPLSYWLGGIVATVLLFASILAHELSHSFMAIRSGIKIPEITLFIFGGISRLASEAKDPKSEFKIAVVGPLMSFVLAFVFWGFSRVLAGADLLLTTAIFQYLAVINLALGIFNLVPGYPLDG